MTERTHRIAVIDFETADNGSLGGVQQASACQIGWQVVEVDGSDARLCDEAGSSLLRPPNNLYSGWDLHGLTPDHTADAPCWLDFWSHSLKPKLDALDVTMLAAHNYGFDRSVFFQSLTHDEGLRAVEQTYGADVPESYADSAVAQAGLNYRGNDWSWGCTVVYARRVWPEMAPRHGGDGHGLGALACNLGLDLSHHDAASDARAAAQVLIKCVQAGCSLEMRRPSPTPPARRRRVKPGVDGPAPLRVLLEALEVPGLGPQRCQALALAFGSLDAVVAASHAELAEVEGMGAATARAVANHFSQRATRKQVDELRGSGVPLDHVPRREQIAATPQVLAGKSVVITGSLHPVEGWFEDRTEAKEAIRLLGGRAVSAVTSKTVALVAGDRATAHKVDKAARLGVPVLDENGLRVLLETGEPPVVA